MQAGEVLCLSQCAITLSHAVAWRHASSGVLSPNSLSNLGVFHAHLLEHTHFRAVDDVMALLHVIDLTLAVEPENNYTVRILQGILASIAFAKCIHIQPSRLKGTVIASSWPACYI